MPLWPWMKAKVIGMAMVIYRPLVRKFSQQTWLALLESWIQNSFWNNQALIIFMIKIYVTLTCLKQSPCQVWRWWLQSVSEEPLTRDTHTDTQTHRHRLGVVFLKNYCSKLFAYDFHFQSKNNTITHASKHWTILHEFSVKSSLECWVIVKESALSITTNSFEFDNWLFD